MNILMVASECNPYFKSGGLGDVVSSLALELAKTNDKVAVIMPYYLNMKDKIPTTKARYTMDIKMNWRHQEAKIIHHRHKSVDYYFIQNDYYFSRINAYGYQDDIERFSFFSLTVAGFLKNIRTHFDIIHAHDWQAGFVPLLAQNENYKAKYIMTIHNPAFQGNFSKEHLYDYLNLDESFYNNGTVRFHDFVSFLKTGIMVSDYVTTVSKTHAKELLEDKYSYNELSYILEYKKERFIGIPNGVDYGEFNPLTDTYFGRHHYDSNSVTLNKLALKKKLYKELGLLDSSRPLFAVVSRLTSQKGIDVIVNNIDLLLSKGNLIIIGLGEYEIQETLLNLESEYKGHFKIILGFSSESAHLFYGASDFFLMPSLYEPCGIGQMIAMHYGSLPIVRRVGGLVDTVLSYPLHPFKVAEGFGYEPSDFDGFAEVVTKAFEVYANQEIFLTMQQNAMKSDHSWGFATIAYQDLYDKLIK